MESPSSAQPPASTPSPGPSDPAPHTLGAEGLANVPRDPSLPEPGSGILATIVHYGGHFTPPLPPFEHVFPVKIVTELACDGRAQHIQLVFLPRGAGWEEVRAKLEGFGEQWCWKRKDEEEVGRGWVYQVLCPGKGGVVVVVEGGLRALGGEGDLRGLRKCVLGGGEGREVLVWEKRMRAASQRLKVAANRARDEGEVDFFNVLEMDAEMSLPVVVARKERNRGGEAQSFNGRVQGDAHGNCGKIVERHVVGDGVSRAQTKQGLETEVKQDG